MAYLISRYPAVSHTFILREVARLRMLGHTVRTASINPPDRHRSQMEQAERQEADDTYFVKAHGAAGALLALAYWLRHAPRRLAGTLLAGARLGGAGRFPRGLAYAVEAAMVARWMAMHDMRMLHVHFGNAGATVGMLVKHLSRCHLSYTIHGPDEFDDVPGQHLSRKVAEADSVVCISQFARGQLMRISDPRHWPKLAVCRLGVDPDAYAFQPRPPQQAALRLLCVGRLTPAKGQVLLVQACERLRRRGLRFSLTLVGEGPDRTRIEAMVDRLGLAHEVTLTGALNPAQVQAHLRQADIFVLPSLAEGIPVVLMEAMSSGLPCVSTAVNGIPELIEDEHTGLLATAGDLDSLVAQLGRLMLSPALRAQLAQAARAKVVAEFDLARNVGRLSGIFSRYAAEAA